jgi:hypothetical protein
MRLAMMPPASRGPIDCSDRLAARRRIAASSSPFSASTCKRWPQTCAPGASARVTSHTIRRRCDPRRKRGNSGPALRTEPLGLVSGRAPRSAAPHIPRSWMSSVESMAHWPGEALVSPRPALPAPQGHSSRQTRQLAHGDALAHRLAGSAPVHWLCVLHSWLASGRGVWKRGAKQANDPETIPKRSLVVAGSSAPEPSRWSTYQVVGDHQ